LLPVCEKVRERNTLVLYIRYYGRHRTTAWALFMRRLIGISVLLALGSGCASTTQLAQPEQPTNTYFGGEQKLEAALNRVINQTPGAARNVILFVGDGMSIPTVTASRIYAGQARGQTGEEYNLSFDSFPFAGLSRTYNTDAQTPDSAGTMTAMVTGVKTRAGVLSVGPGVQTGECASQSGHELMSILTLAELAGKSTGIVSTARITHATPAALYANTVNRDWENDAELSDEAKSHGCEDIASQLLTYPARASAWTGKPIDGPELVLGGGAANFLPTNQDDSAFNGKRKDGRNLVSEWQNADRQGAFVKDRSELEQLDQTDLPVLGLFQSSHMSYRADRPDATSTEPSLAELTEKAIELLSSEKGFFLMVEAGRIDHAHHAGSAVGALTDTVELSDAVARARALTSDSDTLIIVTADHSHVMTMAGYPKRGNPILGKVVNIGEDEPKLAADGAPYTTLSYANGRGFAELGAETNADVRYGLPVQGGRHLKHDTDTESPGYHQEALVPLSSETHGGDDVAIYASGPGAHLLSGSLEQNVIFHVMRYMADLPHPPADAEK
jgi:alkaline phosphatase